MTFEFSKEKLASRMVAAGIDADRAARLAELPKSNHAALMCRIKDFSQAHADLTQCVSGGKFQIGRIGDFVPLADHISALQVIAREVGAIS